VKFDSPEFLEDLTAAARAGSDDELRVLGGLAAQTRDWHVFMGNHMIAEGFQAVALACAQVRDERARLARLDFDPGVTSFPDPDVS
jgi:hypothetical protein